jgi:hypothetical protein
VFVAAPIVAALITPLTYYVTPLAIVLVPVLAWAAVRLVCGPTRNIRARPRLTVAQRASLEEGGDR